MGALRLEGAPRPAPGYPAPRRMPPLGAGFPAERYYRFESTGAEATAGATDSEIIVFSGYPDKIVLHARTNGAFFTLTDRFTGEEDEIFVQAGLTETVYLKRNRLLARRSGAADADVFACGYWICPPEAGDVR